MHVMIYAGYFTEWWLWLVVSVVVVLGAVAVIKICFDFPGLLGCCCDDPSRNRNYSIDRLDRYSLEQTPISFTNGIHYNAGCGHCSVNPHATVGSAVDATKYYHLSTASEAATLPALPTAPSEVWQARGCASCLAEQRRCVEDPGTSAGGLAADVEQQPIDPEKEDELRHFRSIG